VDILNTDKTNELRLALSTLPITGPDIDLFYKLCPHLSESQAENLYDSTENFTLFAVPDPGNPNIVIIILLCAGYDSEEEEIDDKEEGDDSEVMEEDDDGYAPPRISIIDKIDITKDESYYSAAFELNALFVKEAIEWQLANK